MNLCHVLLFNSCSALNPANQSWASVLHSFVTSQDIRDHVVFKHSPFRTSCSAVELTSDKKQDVRITVAFRGNKAMMIIFLIPCFNFNNYTVLEEEDSHRNNDKITK